MMNPAVCGEPPASAGGVCLRTFHRLRPLTQAARLAACGVLLVLVLNALAADSAPAPRKPFGQQRTSAVYSTATSCAAASCHGSGDGSRPGGEYTTWAGSDPHAKAYRVLFNDTSARIMANLRKKDSARTATASTDATCLKCHAVDEPKSFDGMPHDDRALTEGAACEACHGASGKWRTAHYQPGFRGLALQDKFEQYGLTPLKDIVARTQNCASCHVGDRDREVNHDLIAAGHPRLAFEFTRYHYSPRLTKHWVEPVANPAFELRAWFLGQVSTLRSTADLLAVRAERAIAKSAPWPELAETSCFACHQSLTGPPRGGRRGDRPSGIAAWQPWYSSLVALLPNAAAIVTPSIAAPPTPSLLRLKKLMETPDPDAAAVAPLARAAVVELDDWLAKLQTAPVVTLAPEACDRLLAAVTETALTKDRSAIRDGDWDSVAVHTLAITAAYHAAGGATMRPAWKAPLGELRAAVAYPPGTDSPKDFQPKTAFAPLRQLYDLTHPAETIR